MNHVYSVPLVYLRTLRPEPRSGRLHFHAFIAFWLGVAFGLAVW